MQSAQDCMCNNISEARNGASVWCIFPQRNMRTPPIIIGGEFSQDPSQVLFVEHDQMIDTLTPDRPDQAFNIPVIRYVSGGASDVLLILVDWPMVRPSGTWGTGST